MNVELRHLRYFVAVSALFLWFPNGIALGAAAALAKPT